MDKEFIQLINRIDLMHRKFESYFSTNGDVFMPAGIFDDLTRLAVQFGVKKLHTEGYIIDLKSETLGDYCLRVAKTRSVMGEKVDSKKGVSFRLRLLKFQKLVEEANKDQATVNEGIKFDPQNGLITYGGKTYHMRSALKKELMKKMWEEKRIIKRSNVIKKGEIFPKSAFAVQIGIIDSPSKYDNKAKKILKKQQTELNRSFNKYHFPLRIKSFGTGYLLIETQD